MTQVVVFFEVRVACACFLLLLIYTLCSQYVLRSKPLLDLIKTGKCGIYDPSRLGKHVFPQAYASSIILDRAETKNKAIINTSWVCVLFYLGVSAQTCMNMYMCTCV